MLREEVCVVKSRYMVVLPVLCTDTSHVDSIFVCVIRSVYLLYIMLLVYY